MMRKGRFLKSGLHVFKMDIFGNGTGMSVDKAHTIKAIQIVGDLRSELELKVILSLISLILNVNIGIFRFGQMLLKHYFFQYMPCYTVILAVRISVAKNECFQLIVLVKTRRAGLICTSRFHSNTGRDQSLVMVFTS